MREGGRLVGYGVASATYPAKRLAASAKARLLHDGTVVIEAATHEFGTGTCTAMSQVAADALGLPVGRVTFEWGDTVMPENPISAGSMTAASTGPAVQAAALTLANRLHALGCDLNSRVSCRAAVDDNGGPIEATGSAGPGDEVQRYSMHSFGAVFAEVGVDPDLGSIHVTRVVGVYGAGRILNRKTATSQMAGGIIYGLSMALAEQTLIDPRTGRYVNADFSEYHVPVNADIPTIDVIFVDEADPHVNPLGVKGIGEIGTTGVAAAVAKCRVPRDRCACARPADHIGPAALAEGNAWKRALARDGGCMAKTSEREIVTVGGHDVTISNPSKILFPQAGLTKRDLVGYYLAVADGALRGAGGRPNMLLRRPDGIDADPFFQKRAPASRPDWIEVVTLSFPSGRTADEVVPRGAAALAWMANLACTELHPHPVRAEDVDHPDELRIDLDPTPGISWTQVKATAGVVQATLDDFGLRGLAKNIRGTRHARLRPHRAPLGIRRRPTSGPGLRAGSRTTRAEARDEQMVEGRTPRCLPRLQPECKRPHRGRGLLGPPDTGCARVRAHRVERVVGMRSGGIHDDHDAGPVHTARRSPPWNRRPGLLAGQSARTG